MVRFSRQNEVGLFCAPCEQGNAFVAYCPNDTPPINGIVNDIPTQIAQIGPPVRNGLTLEETSGALELEVGGTRYPLFADLDQFNRTRAEDVGIAIGMYESAAGQSPQEIPSNASGDGPSDDVYFSRRRLGWRLTRQSGLSTSRIPTSRLSAGSR